METFLWKVETVHSRSCLFHLHIIVYRVCKGSLKRLKLNHSRDIEFIVIVCSLQLCNKNSWVENQRSIVFLPDVFGEQALSKASVFNWLNRLKPGRDGLLRQYWPWPTSLLSQLCPRTQRGFGRLLKSDSPRHCRSLISTVRISITSEDSYEENVCEMGSSAFLRPTLKEYGQFLASSCDHKKTWIPYYSLETKEQSSKWVAVGKIQI